MSRRITPSTTLDNLKKEAKRWLRALRDNAADARARFQRALAEAPAVPTLRDVQLALAREHGLSGWAALRAALGARVNVAAAPDDLLDRFLENACPDHHVRGGPAHLRARHTAARLLAQHPELADATFVTEVVCGDLAAVETALHEHPALANAKNVAANAVRAGLGHGGRWLTGDLDRNLGSKDWPPLLFLAFTRLDRAESNANAVAIATRLLDNGADPNAFFMAGDSRYTPLVGVIGEGEEDRPPHPHRDELVRLLLDRGAEPYDIQVVYNIHFHGRVLWFLELIYERSVQLGRKADWENPDWSMLDMGGYGNGARWHLWIAIDHDDVALAEWCLEHGANPNAEPARAKNFPQRSLYEEAVRRGCDEIAALLLQHGAEKVKVTLDAVEVLRTAAFRLDTAATAAQLAKHPELLRDPTTMIAAAQRNRADVVELLLDAGVSPDVETDKKERALHAAAYHNALDVAQLLIDRGAAVDPVEQNWNNTPIAAAIYAQHWPVIELLGQYSRDIWELVYAGRIDRVRDLLAEQPALAKTANGEPTLLMWLPAQDEDLALAMARLLLQHGADARLKNSEGMTAADRAERLGMARVATALRDAATPVDHRPTLARFEEMAANLLDAYRTGTPEAMQRHWRDTWHQRAWPAMRRYVLLDLGRVPGVDDAYIDITLDDARLHVAKEQAFDTWAELTEFVTSLPPGPRMIAARPVQVFSHGGNDPRAGDITTREWAVAIEALMAQQLDGLAAHGQMTDAALEFVSQVQHITSLRLDGSKALTDAGIQHLVRLSHLRHLDLGGTQVTDAGLRVLRALPELETLDLSWTQVTDAGIAELAHCVNLRHVELGGTRTGDGAIRALGGKEKLSHLNTGALVTDAGLALLHELPVFKEWRGGEVVLELTSPDAGPNMLVLHGAFTDRSLARLVGLDGLFGLDLDDSQLGLAGAALAPLVALPHLGKLSFDAHDDAMPHIAALPHLRFLSAQDTDATDEGWGALARSQSIEGIWGRRCHGLRGRGFRALSTMPALRMMAVSCLNVDDAAIALLPAFPALREIMPMDIPDAGYRHIGQCENLEALTLMYCRDTTDAATEHLTALRNLRKYFASYTRITDRTPELLSEIASLEKIEFSGCAGLTDKGIVSLARLPHLRELSIGGTHRVTRAVLTAFGSDVRVRYST